MRLVSVFIVLSVIINLSNQEDTSSSAPYLAYIYRATTDESKEPSCIGILISTKRVLTAASCLENATEGLTISTVNENASKMKMLSYVVPEPSKSYSDQMAVATIDASFELDGRTIAKIDVDAEDVDEDFQMINEELPVVMYFYSLQGIERRTSIPKGYVEGIDLLNKHLYLGYNSSDEANCTTIIDPNKGCPVVRNNLLVGVVVREHIVEKDKSCPTVVGGIAIRTSIYATWIEDQIRKDMFTKTPVNSSDEVSAPYLVSIRRHTITGAPKHFCHGSLITTDIILTAAICLKNDIDDLVVVAGISSLTDELGQRRKILLYESSKVAKSKNDRDEIAVARVYPPFLKDNDVSTIPVSPDKMCGKLRFSQFLFDPDKIHENNFVLVPDAKLPETEMEMKPVVANAVFDCTVKLSSSIGAPVFFQEEQVGVIMSNIEEENCDLVTPKKIIRLDKLVKWFEEQLEETL